MRSPLSYGATLVVVFGAFCGSAPAADPRAPATAQVVDAAALYLKAADLATVDCPASSNLEYENYPPYSPAWHAMARAAWEANGESRRLARAARAAKAAAWPEDMADVWYLNRTRHVANQLGDAAVYAHLHGDHAEAARLVRDTLHLADLLEQSPGPTLVRVLVAGGIRVLAANRAMIVASGVGLRSDPANVRDLSVADAKALVAHLSDQWTIERQLAVEPGPLPAEDGKRLVESLNRVRTEGQFAAISLACHLYRFEHKRWPATLADLVPAQLPAVPTDPWARNVDDDDGNPAPQPLGYVVVKAGLPDGGDRPLVYSRAESRDGLFFRTDAPQYAFYHGDGTDRPMAHQRRGGQFRDVVRWVPPAKRAADAPTVQPLP